MHYKEYCAGIYRNTGINCFWVINNAQSVLHSVQTLNSTFAARELDTFDFSTLYTSISHHSLKVNMKWLIEEAFKIRDAHYLSLTRKGKCFWSTQNKYDMNLSLPQLVGMVDYLVDNIYVCVGDKVFHQRVGIPMGTDCAPLLANLYLFYFEYTYMKSLMKSNMSKARTFSNTFRYIDDLLTLNNPSFERAIGDIYPPELVLKKTTGCNDVVSYLDLAMKINNSQFCTTVYDKRDDFNFKIVNFPYMDSNIPAGPAYGVYISQLVRIGRICDKYEEFTKRNLLITTRLMRQGFRYTRLVFSFKKFFVKYIHLLNKCGVCMKRHISDGICDLYYVQPSLYKHVTIQRPR